MLRPRGLSCVALFLAIASPALADPKAPALPAAPPATAPPAQASAQAPAAPAPPADSASPATSDPAPAAPIAPAPAAPAPAAAPAPVPAPAPAPPLPPPARHDLARVHLAADYPGAALELRSYIDSGEWKVLCGVPCDRELMTLGAEARVSAPGMSTSNVFRIDPGPGVALVKVSGGSATARTFGILGLGIGIPLGLTGTAMYSYGSYDDQDGLAIAGGVILGTGAAMIIAAIPLLLSGTTNVTDGKGRLIAASESPSQTE